MNWSLRLYIYDLTLFKKYINVLFASSLAEQHRFYGYDSFIAGTSLYIVFNFQ